MAATKIGSEGAIRQLPTSLQQLMSFERFHLHRAGEFQDKAQDPNFDASYFPQNCAAIKLPCFWVERKHLYVYGDQSHDDSALRLLDRRQLEERVLLAVHPTSLPHYADFLSNVHAESFKDSGVCIWGVPTSSVRTFLAWPDEQPEKAIFLKTSLHSPIFGDRHLYRKKVGGSVGLSELMRLSQPQFSEILSYFPESLGYVPRLLQDGGVIVRSIPREIKESEIVVAPMFSLMGDGPGERPLFLTILEQSRLSARQFVEEWLCVPFTKLWLKMSMDHGLLLEAHAQDLLLQLTPNLTPVGRFYYRDCEGLQVDWQLRQSRGLLMPKNLPLGSSWYDTYATWGYPCTQLAWYKWYLSLFGYLHYVLNELGLSLQAWQRRGLLGGKRLEQDELTMMFSHHMLRAIGGMFAIRVVDEYNVYRHLKKFVIFLMRIRRHCNDLAS